MTSSDLARRHPEFLPRLDQLGVVDLDQSPDSIYGLWPDLTLAYMNPAWFAFARNNGGEPAISEHWSLGVSVLEATPQCLRRFYQDLFLSAAQASVDLHPPQHEYDCSSAELRRRFIMTIYPVRVPKCTALLVVNSLLVETPYPPSEAAAATPDLSIYVDEAGLIRQCAHCRKIRVARDATAWHFVPEWVQHPQRNVSHTLCDLCLKHYYPAAADDD